MDMGPSKGKDFIKNLKGSKKSKGGSRFAKKTDKTKTAKQSRLAEVFSNMHK